VYDVSKKRQSVAIKATDAKKERGEKDKENSYRSCCSNAAFSVTACKQEAKKASGTLVVWSFTDELKKMSTITMVPLILMSRSSIRSPDDHSPTARPCSRSGQGAPDVFALEDAFVRKYIESGLLLDLSYIATEVKAKALAIRSKSVLITARSWSFLAGYPGAMFYRRSLAKKYLGSMIRPKSRSMLRISTIS
jgi:hypothetical protein